MKNPYRIALLLASGAFLIAGCSNGQEGADSSPVSLPGSNVPEISVRNPTDPILGDVSPDGKCDESVIGIDHERPTAHITYKGQPGDKIRAEIIFMDDSKESKTQSFEMGSMQDEMQLPTNIPNSSISNIKVNAEGRVGTPGECTIEVK